MRVACDWPFTKFTIQVNSQPFLYSGSRIFKLLLDILYTVMLFFFIFKFFVSLILIFKSRLQNIPIHNSKVKNWRNRFYEPYINQSLKPGFNVKYSPLILIKHVKSTTYHDIVSDITNKKLLHSN